MHGRLSIAILTLISLHSLPLASAHAAEAGARSSRSYATAYFEGSHLSKAGTLTGLIEPRAGTRWDALGLEAYAVARIGADSRTLIDSSDDVYNDNVAFIGGGADYLGLLSGVRLTLQLGRSFDLNHKLHLAGFDLRGGFQTYHEINWKADRLVSEVYSEGFYLRRYRNTVASAQFRTLYRVYTTALGPGRFYAGPMLTGAASADSEGMDYNRFAELHAGARANYLAGPISLSLSPYWVAGTRWAKESSLPHYQDFRLVLAGFVSF